MLMIHSGGKVIGWVDSADDPVLTMCAPSNPSLTFMEIEHIMDCWHNMPRE
jgi:hypothetical protein